MIPKTNTATKKNPNRMTFIEHLEELRYRLLASVVAIFVAFGGCYYFSDKLLAFLEAPLKTLLPQGAAIIGTGLAEAFAARMMVALVAAVVVACPFWFYELWRFVSPGLYPGEKKLVVPFVLFASIFFVSGVVFGYYVVFPTAFSFFMSQYTEAGISAQIKIGEYFGFTTKLLLAFGLCFEFPIAAFFFGRVGIITWRGMVKAGKYAIVIIFIVAAVLTPGPDVASQLLLAGPLLLLYGISIAIVAATGKRKKEEKPAEQGQLPQVPDKPAG